MALEYDFNFCFPVKELESDRVKLVPFIPAKHLDAFISLQSPSYEYLPFGPFDTAESFLSGLFESRIQPTKGCMLYAILDKTKNSGTGCPNGALAGVIGFTNSNAANLVVEVAFVLVSPEFQKTHVTSNAIGLLLHYALDPPEAGGLGLRRVAWAASPLNGPSIKAAERMGFKKEGYIRWHWVLPEHKQPGNGIARRAGDPMPEKPGRDTVLLGLCWDDWESGVKEHVAAVMARLS